ncbi:ARM repeat domain-containing protein [Chloropicon primus]|uniref:ARM repeat domain-containing protein n=3 Tax=Chloropicon primus TaxID=1764295 RepID=A0A5B8MH12_9CHLO|nr:ARM repeat domain-containing protein [Chloropicon primus]UPQ99199.1 ARM repeat domain-containing protein [Chloropicon primus]|eukprot:QDZ19988.1 ARM repeat domain-containing protein [Chloropicon primus]
MAGAGGSETLLRAVHELYHNPDKEVKKRAEQWFGEFQRSFEAWTSLLEVLQNSGCPTEARHLCSIGLKNKCLLDLEGLPKESVDVLRESIVSLLLAAEPLNGPIRTQLCLAFSGIAAHVPGPDWNGVGMVPWVEQRLSGGAKPLSVVRMVEIMCILAEEYGSYKPAVHPNRRRQYCKELESSSAKAFQMLTFAAQEQALLNDAKPLKCLLQAFSSWLNLGGPEKLKASCANTPLQLHNHPLVALSVNCLQSQDMEVFDMAVDVMCTLVNCTLSENVEVITPEAVELVNMLMGSALSLRPRLLQYVSDTKAGKDVIEMEDMVKSIAKFLVEISEAYIFYIAKGQSDFLVMVEAMLEVASHPDNEVSSMTFGFWYRLSKILVIGVDPDTEMKVLGEMRQPLIEMFNPAFSKLVGHLIEHVVFADDVDSWSKGDHKDFRKVRYTISDTLTDANLILGPDTTLSLILEPLQVHHSECSAGKSFDWRIAEAAYFCSKSISRSMPFDSALVYNLLCAIPTLPRQPQLLYTSCSVVGSFSSWVAGAMKKGKLPDASLLTSLLSFSSGALQDKDASSAAAIAFKHLCDSCCGLLGEFSEQLFSVYNAVITGSPGALESEDVIEVLEGVIFVAMAMDADKKQAAVQVIVQPILTPLQAMLGGSPAGNEVQALRLLEQLETVYKNVSDKQLVMQLLDHTSSIFDRALEVLGPHVECAEKVCSALKYGLKTTGTSTAQELLQHLFTNIPLRFSRYSHPCLLYLSSELVKIFGGQTQSHGWLQALVSGLVAKSHNKLMEIKNFDSRPDIVDDLFLLAGRVLTYAPAILFLEGGFQTLQLLFNCAVAGMYINHRDALLSIYAFFYLLLDTKNEYSAKALEAVLVPAGLILTKKLLAGITGAVPKAYLEDLGESLHRMLRVAKQLGLSWLHESLSCIPRTSLSDEEKQTFMVAAQEYLSNGRHRSFLQQVKEVSQICRRNDKVMRECNASLLASS